MSLFAEYAVVTSAKPGPDRTPPPVPDGTPFFDMPPLVPVDPIERVMNAPIHVTSPSSEFAGILAVEAATHRGLGEVDIMSIEFVRYRQHSLDLASGLPIDEDGNVVDISDEDDTVVVVSRETPDLDESTLTSS